jgi:hypothetical protein
MKLELDCVGGSGVLVSKMLQAMSVTATQKLMTINRRSTLKFVS